MSQHDHAGHGHDHGVSADADQKYLAIALALIVAFMAGEVVTGIIASSLALLSDAAHMLTDAAAIALAIGAARLARRPPKGAMTFGLKRAEILSAQINGVTLLVLAGVILYEAIRRLIDPPEVEGGIVLIVAIAGIGVNVTAAWSIAKANRRSLNVEGSFRHIVTDLYAFIGTAIAGLVVLLTGFDRADALASIVVAALMLHAGFILVAKSGRIFLEAAPAGVDPDEIGRAMAAQAGVSEIHDLHVWEVTSGFPSLTAHVLVDPDVDCHRVREHLTAIVHDRFGIDHTTLQVDHDHRDELVQIEHAKDAPA